jgi:hypothetical protein
MKYRKHKIFSGQTLNVPQHIVRLDDQHTHGWQLRYGKSKFFADHSNDGSGAAEALRLATEELAKRISRLPAPTRLRTDVMKNKKTDLPLGISGPIPRLRPGRLTPYYNFQVSIPIPGARSTNKNVYIGAENTMTPERIEQALAKAIALRDSHVRKKKLASTKSKREAAAAAGIVPA